MRLVITLHGCDDETSFVLDVDRLELAAIQRVADASKATSEYGCMPTLTLREAIERDEATS